MSVTLILTKQIKLGVSIQSIFSLHQTDEKGVGLRNLKMFQYNKSNLNLYLLFVKALYVYGKK